ncbi:hypothetical protein FRC04_008614 [Tulasnella sp. 424]|nr:hypothetical protein FRC04_008614 [Tulasnella sp. 424]KAG8970744.1 hypothetical protein FRC05_011695 [Tulasnella sp. 425]
MSAGAMGLLSYLQSVAVTAWAAQSPFSTTPVTDIPTHSREPSVLSPVVSVEDDVSVSRDIVPSSSSYRLAGITSQAIEANGSLGPLAVATTAAAAPPVVNGSAGTQSPSKGEASKAFGSLPTQTPATNLSSTAASSTTAPSPTPSNASTAVTSSAARPKRKLDANKLFQAPSSFTPQPTPSAAPRTNPTAPPPTAAVPPYHHNEPNSSVMAAHLATNSPGQRFSTLPSPANHGSPYYHPSPQMADQQPVGVGTPSHLRPVAGPPTGGQRSPSVSSRLPINVAVPPPPTVTVNGASQGRGPQSAAGQPPGPLTRTVPQVGSPRIGHQPPAMQQQQQQQQPGPVPAPGQMPGQPPCPPQQMQTGRQQPQYRCWLSQQQALSGLEPVPALQQSENRWTPATRSKLSLDENSAEFVERKVKALLNKLRLENFDSVSNQIISWANKSEHEKNGATLILVIKLVIDKATDEAHWSEMYARLCRKMMEQISVNVQDDSIRNNVGEPVAGGHLFRKYLLNRCQEDFERGRSQKVSAQAAAALKVADDKAAADTASKAGGGDNEPVLFSDEYYALLKAKRQGLGLVRFIGELFKLQMLTERTMHQCIQTLLSKIDKPEEEEIESLCKLLTTVGQALDTPKAKSHMDIYFGRMQMLADNPNVVSRIRYMLLDVIELRGRSWRPRNAVAGPSTIAQVHEQGAREKAASAQLASKMVPMSRTGSQRGPRNAQEQGSDGWNVAGPTPVRAVPIKAGDLSNFGKFTANSGPPKTMGPSSVFKEGGRRRDIPAPQAPPDTTARTKFNLLPRTVSSANTDEHSAEDSDKPESDEEQVNVKTYTDWEATVKVKEDVKEFFTVRDVSKGKRSFAEMPDEYKGKLVHGLASRALDSKEADVKLVAELFEKVAGKSCSPSAFEEGLAGIIEFLDDTATDLPEAYTFMARMLRGSKLPQETVESLADKIFVDGEPLVKPRDKLLAAYAAVEKEKLQALSLSRTASVSCVATPASAPPKLASTDSGTYLDGIKTPSMELNQGQTKGSKDKYDRDFLLQFMAIFKDKPDHLSSLDALRVLRSAGGDDNSGPYVRSTPRNPQYPYMQPEWSPPVQDPQIHQHPHQQGPSQYYG